MREMSLIGNNEITINNESDWNRVIDDTVADLKELIAELAESSDFTNSKSSDYDDICDVFLKSLNRSDTDETAIPEIKKFGEKSKPFYTHPLQTWNDWNEGLKRYNDDHSFQHLIDNNPFVAAKTLQLGKENETAKFVDLGGRSSEWLFALRHPIIAADIGQVVQGKGVVNISTNAVRFATNDLGLNENNSKEGSQVNAFRHALWTATISNKYGVDIAREAVESHEDGHVLGRGRAIKNDLTPKQISHLAFPTLLEADGVCDFLNNEIGVQLELNSNTPMNEIALETIDVYHTDGLWVAVKHADGSYRVQKDILSDGQYNNARKRLEQLNKYGFDQKQYEEAMQQAFRRMV